jgi:hypothetical protein
MHTNRDRKIIKLSQIHGLLVINEIVQHKEMTSIIRKIYTGDKIRLSKGILASKNEIEMNKKGTYVVQNRKVKVCSATAQLHSGPL